MKTQQTILVTLTLALLAACQPSVPTTSEVNDVETELFHATQLRFSSYYDFQDAAGQTYLSFMKNDIKPAMDVLATEGYQVSGSDMIERAYLASNTKVKRKVNRWGLDNVKEIADALEGQTVTLHTLPGQIARVNSRVDRYNLSTFMGMASGGGVKIRYFDANYGLNVHYDTAEERSGRSFGVGPTRGANDASDKQYLDDLQDYTNHSPDNSPEFYKALFESLLNSDASNYANVSDEGQTVLTDFLSVYTAEQARNLMDGRVHPHWDAALLEVTLLASFHAGQDELKLFYKNPETGETSFTNRTLRQTPCRVPSQSSTAKMRDYWQFSRNINSESNCGRSGINITKNEFRKLGTKITGYLYTNHRDLFEELKASLTIEGSEYNLFHALSEFLIDGDAAETLSEADVERITSAWVKMLDLVRLEANQISASIEATE